MSRSPVTAQECYARIVKTLLANPDVALGAAGKKGFGSSALSTKTKIFAMLSSKGHFVVKLSKLRVDALVASGKGKRFDPGHGRLMKEWLEVDAACKDEWLGLAKEAKEFVASRH